MMFFSGCLTVDFWIGSPVMIPLAAFQVWMLVTALRFRNWAWFAFMLVFPVFGAFWYWIFHVGQHATTDFQLPGAVARKRLRQVQAEVARLDKAHAHAELGDLYFQRGDLTRAEASYRAALARDPTDLDTRAHLGQALVRLGRAGEARPLLEGVVAEKPRHDHGHTRMALAEALTALGEHDAALALWKQVTASNSYSRARVQLAELYAKTGQRDLARAEVEAVLRDDRSAPAFDRRRDRAWVRRARKLARALRVRA